MITIEKATENTGIVFNQDTENRITHRHREVRQRVGQFKLILFHLISKSLSVFRKKTPLATDVTSAELQRPWMPKWPKLLAKPFHDPNDFPWIKTLEQNKHIIQEEFEALLESEQFGVAKYIDEGKDNWKTFFFFLDYKKVEENCQKCPRTTELLEKLPINKGHICFSAIEPHTEIPPHVGPTNTMLVAHLGLKNCDNAFVNVANHVQYYKEGEFLILDDSFVHFARNDSDKIRFTLMITFWHPQMNGLEKKFVNFVAKNV
jgi:aspartyl/asparaginyl beta-hydroxylase (cupin superfamily)